MKLYKTSSTESVNPVKWDSSAADASKTRTAMCAEHSLKRTQVKTEEVEFKQDKAGILALLNEHAAG